MLGYASRTGTRRNLDALRAAGWGLVVSAAGRHRDEGFEDILLDNGAWSYHWAGRSFDPGPFRAILSMFGTKAGLLVAPDVVEGGLGSLALSVSWLPDLAAYPGVTLIPVQDGMEDADVRSLLGPRVGIFLGGSTVWKLATVDRWGRLAREVGCWYHVGRVNSARRIAMCHKAGANSFDGSCASRFSVKLPLLEAARDLRERNGQGRMPW